MKTIRFHEYGGPEVLRYEDVDVPVPGAGQVLVRVAATAFNPLDAGIRGGYVREAIPVRLPHVPGYDLAGTVQTLGEGVDSFKEGDSVIGFLSMISDGAAAQYAVVPARELVAAPTRIPLPDAAALPSVGTTAWQIVFDAAHLQKGQRVLINGAGGSVGRLVTQLAAHAGAHVIAVSTPSSADRLWAAGANEVIDRNTGAVEAGAPVDALVNLGAITSEAFQRLVAQVRSGGVVVNVVPSVPTPGDPDRDVRGIGFFVHSDTDDLAHLVELIDEGKLEVDIAERVPLQSLGSVHERSDQGELRGKVLVLPPSD